MRPQRPARPGLCRALAVSHRRPAPGPLPDRHADPPGRPGQHPAAAGQDQDRPRAEHLLRVAKFLWDDAHPEPKPGERAQAFAVMAQRLGVVTTLGVETIKAGRIAAIAEKKFFARWLKREEDKRR